MVNKNLKEEAVPESLKNILLVMASGGFFGADPAISTETFRCNNPGGAGDMDRNRELWEKTWQRLERFLPELKTELFPIQNETDVDQPQQPQAEDTIQAKELEETNARGDVELVADG
jgi:brefeldin A-resistance guanine nucleotide exchange factor 1